MIFLDLVDKKYLVC